MDNKNGLNWAMGPSLANQFERLYKEEKDRRQFAEAELSLIKGIGQNSPEQKALQKELQEVKDDNRKLSLQINDMIAKLRDAQF